MRIFTIFYIVLHTSALSPYFLSQEVGSNCGETDVFQIYGVFITPWPPAYPGMVATLTMPGIFLKDTYVQELVVGYCYNGMIWNYYPYPVNYEFAAQEYFPFEVIFYFPTEKGSYVSNVQLTAGDHISCWQFSYNI